MQKSLHPYEDQQHSLPKSVFLHLFPGMLIILFFIIFTPIVKKLGFPVMMASSLAVIFIMIPIQIRIMVRQVKKQRGSSIMDLIPYREKVPVWQLFIILIPLLVWTSFIFDLFIPFDQYLLDHVFSFLPEWFVISDDDFSQYSRIALLLTWVTGIIVNGFLGPITEELYFRGYLLPRISRFGNWSVLMNIVLFSVYNFFSPWQIVSRIIAMLPIGYVVFWKKNIVADILFHVVVNSVSMILMVKLFFN